MSALIKFRDVCKTYYMGDAVVRAADHITMKIEKGEFVAIVGQSGSGKSTFSIFRSEEHTSERQSQR